MYLTIGADGRAPDETGLFFFVQNQFYSGPDIECL
jgi:hypothetical protein